MPATIVLHPPFRWQREYAMEFVDGVAAMSEREGIMLAVENMYPWRARQREMLAYAPGWDPVPHEYRHVTLDLSHTATAGQDGLEVAQALGDRLVHLHLTDGSSSAKDEHLVPGRGDQPCDAVLGLLAERNWDGTVVVEVNTPPLPLAGGTAQRSGGLAGLRPAESRRLAEQRLSTGERGGVPGTATAGPGLVSSYGE